jgi:8-oxo-dGTP pyrophosphatase MutT (NUDIX family)
MNVLKKYAFWILSRTGLAVYSRLPLFGPLRVAVGVIRNNDNFLVIERSDGRGLSFPGGIAMPWEDIEKAMAREVSEETGLKVVRAKLKFTYFSDEEIPVNLAVFEAVADGQLQSSWEGTPFWLPAATLRQRLLLSQKRIVDAFSEPPPE